MCQQVFDLGNKTVREFLNDVLPAAFARTADEIFITSTAGGIMPVTRIDGEAVGSGLPGALTNRLNQAYWALHENPDYTTPVDYQETENGE